MLELQRPGIDGNATLPPASLTGEFFHGITHCGAAPMAPETFAMLRPRTLSSRISTSPFTLHHEYMQSRSTLQARREKYFSMVDGKKEINLDSGDIEAARHYGNAVLNGTKELPDGSLSGLRVRAAERNKGNEEMGKMAKMSLAERVAYVKKHPTIHLKPGSQDFLHARDYPKATAGEGQWGEALFYHDAPLLIEGILASNIEDRIDYAQGTVENFVIEFHILGLIPNGSSLKLNSRSQPPSLTRMGWHVMRKWLSWPDQQDPRMVRTVMETAELELSNYWKKKRNLIIMFQAPNSSHLETLMSVPTILLNGKQGEI
jgi:hypothetical protein